MYYNFYCTKIVKLNHNNNDSFFFFVRRMVERHNMRCIYPEIPKHVTQHMYYANIIM
jgi:hypothetical protein